MRCWAKEVLEVDLLCEGVLGIGGERRAGESVVILYDFERIIRMML